MRTLVLLIPIALAAACGGGTGPGVQDVASPQDTPFNWDQGAPPVDATLDSVPGADTVPLDSAPGFDTPPMDTGPGPDAAEPCDPGTQCWADEWVILASKVTFVVNGTAFNPDWFLLDALPPADLTIPVEVRSTGMNPLNLVAIFLEEGSNPHISLHWTGDVQPADLPIELMAPGTAVSLEIRYNPPAGATEAGPAFLTVWSGDPDHPSRSLKLPVKQPGPDINAPLNWSNFGCSVYCMDAPFELFNSGTEPLVIQSASFKKPSAEWSLVPAFPPGLTLAPAGQPGTTSFAFNVNYCDADGAYGDDSNELQIFSNDPDENPYGITLTVQPPDECP
jgi:hypothetical protein